MICRRRATATLILDEPEAEDVLLKMLASEGAGLKFEISSSYVQVDDGRELLGEKAVRRRARPRLEGKAGV